MSQNMTFDGKMFSIDKILCFSYFVGHETNFEVSVVPIVKSKTLVVKIFFKHDENFFGIERTTHGLNTPFKKASFHFNYTDVLTFGNGNSLLTFIEILNPVK
jgi:hypothetical protein